MLQLIVPLPHVENLHHIASIACLVHPLVQSALLVKCSQISWRGRHEATGSYQPKDMSYFLKQLLITCSLGRTVSQFRILSLWFLVARLCLRAFFRCFHSLPPWGVQVLMNIAWRWETVASRWDGLSSANQELHNQAKPLHRLLSPFRHSST